MNSLLRRSSNLARLAGIGLVALMFAVGCAEDGQDGASPILEKAEAGEEDCDHGGTVFTTGYDVDGDGEIDDVIDETVLCDGAPGADGSDGDAGEQGAAGSDGIVVTSTEEPGENCEHGGVRIDSGVDEDGDGELDEGDIEDTSYVCNQQCSTGEPLDFDIHTDELPDEYVQGFSYDVGVTTEADYIDINAINPSASVDMDVSYDNDEQELTFEHIEGEAVVDLLLVANDGCDFTTLPVRLGPFDEGLADVYIAHVYPDAGEVDIVDTDAGDDADPIATLDTFDVAGPLEIQWGQYEFDIVDDEGDVIETTPNISIAPFGTELIYAYSDNDDLAFGNEVVETSEIGEDDFRLRAFHTADGAGEVDAYAVGDTASTLLFDNVSFGDVSAATEFPADEDAMAGLDTTDDGDTDVEYMTSVGAFSEGANIDALFAQDGDTTWMVTIDYESNSFTAHDPNLVAYPSSPSATIPQSGGEATDSVTVADCATVDNITMDIEAEHASGFYSTNFTVYLEDPSGTEETLWSEGDTIDGDSVNMIGNFNDTIPADGTGAVEISTFEGTDGDGDWTIRVVNDSCCSDGELHFWQLNLSCSD